MLGHFYGKYVYIIGLQAPGNYSHQFWSNKIWFYYGRTKASEFHDFWIFEPPRNPYLWIWIYQITSTYIRKLWTHFWNYYFYKSQNLGNPTCWHFSKRRAPEMMDIRLCFKMLDARSISIEKTWNANLVIWTRYLSSTLKAFRSFETKNLWNQETKNHETKKQKAQKQKTTRYVGNEFAVCLILCIGYDIFGFCMVYYGLKMVN